MPSRKMKSTGGGKTAARGAARGGKINTARKAVPAAAREQLPPAGDSARQRGAGAGCGGIQPAGDQREALFNAGRIGTAKEIAVTVAEVTRLNGILLELDIECLRVGPVLKKACRDGHELFAEVGRTWFGNHPLFSKAEVRFSGRGLHGILWLASPIVFDSPRKRELWQQVIRAVQRALPTDPAAPDLLGMTRPIGSINSKTGRHVERLRAGEPVTEAEILSFCDDLHRRGMATVMTVLFGSTTVCPCPKCGDPEQSLAAVSTARTTAANVGNRGRCYECGNVTLTDLLELVFHGRPSHAATSPAGRDGEGASDDEGRDS